jgi:predicted GTPase
MLKHETGAGSSSSIKAMMWLHRRVSDVGVTTVEPGMAHLLQADSCFFGSDAAGLCCSSQRVW